MLLPLEMRKEKSVRRQHYPAAGAMAVKMKPLIMSQLVVLCVALRMPLAVADPYANIVSYHCGNRSEYRNGSAFQRNLDVVLDRLVTNVYYSAFNISRIRDERSNNSVYGFVQCTEDLGPYACQQCASTAKTMLVQACNGTSGDIQLNGCRLRYDYHSFYYKSRVSPLNFTAAVWSYCGNNEYINGSAFQRNLNKVLESLAGNANDSGFKTSIVIEEPNRNSTAYGVVQCRGDLGSSTCKQCASTAKANLVDKCHSTSAAIQLDGCFLRYANYNIFNIDSTQNTPADVRCNNGKSTQPQEFEKTVKVLLSNITAKAVKNPKLFAADLVRSPSNLTGHIYSLAQCWGDLSQTSCRSCLTLALEYIFLCQSGALGAQIGADKCHLRYEVFQFFNTSDFSLTPQGGSPRLPESKNGSNFLPRKGHRASSISFHILWND